MNELITFFGTWPNLTLTIIAPPLAIIVGFSWYFSGYCMSRISNLGTKTRAFWHWTMLACASLGSFLFGYLLLVIATMKATAGDMEQWFYQIVGMTLVAAATSYICHKVEKNLIGALTK